MWSAQIRILNELNVRNIFACYNVVHVCRFVRVSCDVYIGGFSRRDSSNVSSQSNQQHCLNALIIMPLCDPHYYAILSANNSAHNRHSFRITYTGPLAVVQTVTEYLTAYYVSCIFMTTATNDTPLTIQITHWQLPKVTRICIHSDGNLYLTTLVQLNVHNSTHDYGITGERSSYNHISKDFMHNSVALDIAIDYVK